MIQFTGRLSKDTTEAAPVRLLSLIHLANHLQKGLEVFLGLGFSNPFYK
jgi:hypothetical protein